MIIYEFSVDEIKSLRVKMDEFRNENFILYYFRRRKRKKENEKGGKVYPSREWVVCHVEEIEPMIEEGITQWDFSYPIHYLTLTKTT